MRDRVGGSDATMSAGSPSSLSPARGHEASCLADGWCVARPISFPSVVGVHPLATNRRLHSLLSVLPLKKLSGASRNL